MREVRRGSNAVEFALTLPLLLLLAAGVVDLGTYLVVADAAVAAAAEGARAGANADTGKQISAATDMARRSWSSSELQGTAEVTAELGGLSAPDERLVVTVEVPYDPYFGFLSLPPTVTYSHTMRLMHQPEP